MKTSILNFLLIIFINTFFCQKSKIGISTAAIISSSEYKTDLFSAGLYFQRSVGIFNYGVNLNYSTYQKVNSYDTLSYYRNESFPEFLFFSKLLLPLKKNLSMGLGIAVGAYFRSSFEMEFKLYKSLNFNGAIEYGNRNFFKFEDNFHDKGQFYNLRTSVYFELN